jgi:hypothetical protein
MANVCKGNAGAMQITSAKNAQSSVLPVALITLMGIVWFAALGRS